jgi:ATP-dependent Clp protease ATP-binding subunit ClpA
MEYSSMKVSVSIEFIRRMASQEAVASDFEEITPNHFLMAILKFSELSTEEIVKIASGHNSAQELKAEVESVRQELKSRSIDSTQIRRRLSEELGRGNYKYKGGMMHRSQAGKALFDYATRLVDDSNSNIFKAEHLLEALLSVPTKLIKQILGSSTGAKKNHTKTLLLDKLGSEPIATASTDNKQRSKDSNVLAKGLIQVLAAQKPKSVILITSDENLAKSTVSKASQVIAARKCPHAINGKRILDITNIEPVSSKALQSLEKLIAEAIAAEEVILFVPPIKSRCSDKNWDQWCKLLKDSLVKSKIQCIWRLDEDTYHEWIEKDKTWRPLAQAMWLGKEISAEIPEEL